MVEVLAVGALAVVLYTFAGYPVLVALWARWSPRASFESADFEPKVSVCLAVHDGARHLAQKLQSLQALDYSPDKLEFLVCSDGSTDETEEMVLRAAATDPRIRLIANPCRLGKPAALNLIRAQATGEILLMTDVRQKLSAGALRALLPPLADPHVGCVSGSLVLSGGGGVGLYWRYEKFIRSCEARLGSMVGVSGSLYAMRRRDLEVLPLDLLLDDMFVPLSLARSKKCSVLSERAEAYDDVCDDEHEFARKVRTLAGNYQLIAKMPWLLVPGMNPVWLQIVSHKLLRLVCPWALAVLLVSSCSLSSDPKLPAAELAFWQALAFGQLLFYGLATLGARAGRTGSLARTFVVLNAAALFGLWRFLRGSQPVTWESGAPSDARTLAKEPLEE